MHPTEQAAEPHRAHPTGSAPRTGELQEPRRTDCPWCGSHRLRTRLRAPDLLQHKAGCFVLDRCQDCGHTFQNPALTAAGREFHCGDLHDGLGPAVAERLLGARHSPRRLRDAAGAMLSFGEPESWLDVGTGRALFPVVAKEVHPYIAFDGLDTGAVVELAAADGHVDEAHRGTLPELAPGLAGRYDAVSMFHHLEHAPDPRAELAAARIVLRPGGHLLIETADPGSRFARLLGRWWISHLQPQHLHLLPLRNVHRALEDLGYTVIVAERRSAHVPYDLTVALVLLVDRCLPGAGAPARPRPPGALRRARRAVLLRVAAPAVATAHAADRLLAPLARRTRFANAYRIIARKEGDRG
ncbi:class I SAM-dependent methyltransferase [Streptomyces sp. TS71-3]|uniref:class I SAM-dependent methyltransferase n=1 Tax=Streptomyces sp. TS71-3 TaxID=2733862 RepID=UPI001B1C759C|nr:class I SAM-dependent methyltransferase [Streptomyces sp. TS71-3]GHJ38129.1 methyltransferase type 12 [Streptomyces sp. TS71-3]